MDGSDCRGYRTTRRNLPSSIAYRPPFTAISRNIGVIDMQTSHTTASAAATTSLARRIVAASWKPVLFAVLMWLSAAAGEIPIPGTPVPITLQTFVVMLAGLMLPWRQAGAAVATYLAAGAVGLPVFAGGTSTLALVGPSAGFLFGFLPGVVVIALLRGKSDTSSFAAAAHRGPLPAGRAGRRRRGGVRLRLRHPVRADRCAARRRGPGLHGLRGWRRHQGRGGLSGRRRPVQARSLT